MQSLLPLRLLVNNWGNLRCTASQLTTALLLQSIHQQCRCTLPPLRLLATKLQCQALPLLLRHQGTAAIQRPRPSNRPFQSSLQHSLCSRPLQTSFLHHQAHPSRISLRWHQPNHPSLRHTSCCPLHQPDCRPRRPTCRRPRRHTSRRRSHCPYPTNRRPCQTSCSPCQQTPGLCSPAVPRASSLLSSSGISCPV